jgi:hypothetical protein
LPASSIRAVSRSTKLPRDGSEGGKQRDRKRQHERGPAQAQRQAKTGEVIAQAHRPRADERDRRDAGLPFAQESRDARGHVVQMHGLDAHRPTQRQRQQR